MSMIGKSLAHYSITAQLGKGGMGEVYQATDTKLGRSVAIKVLPEEFAKEADRIARFQREAKLLASLNHPNIAAIHGLEETDGTHFLVLELVEGQTLAERIKAGPVPVEEALKLGLEIAEALEAAHEKGVIHRDLKPANIKVTPEGTVKVLDFGLAKAYAGDPANMNLSNSPTLSDMATQQGVILGTAAYMPPEQAKGKTVDNRADIWAFGVVLFEMLTGRQLFSGETVSETLAAVIKSEPGWNSLPPNLHFRIRLMLERCLEKDPKRRYGSINDAWVDIEKVLSDPAGLYTQPVVITEPKVKSKQMLVWAAVTVILLIIVGIVVWNLSSPETPAITRLDHYLSEEHQFSQSVRGSFSIAVSPDGRQFVYGTNEGLYVRSLDDLDARLIAGTDEFSESPFFSPDSKSIAYFSRNDGQLKKVSIAGGAPSFLCNIPILGFAGGRWYEDNTIAFTIIPGGIMRIPEMGGTPEPLTKKTDLAEMIAKGGVPAFPQILPDGKTLLYTQLNPGSTDSQIAIQPIISEEKNILFAGSDAQYLPTGHILYTLTENNITNLFAAPFDLEKLEVTGGSISILQGVSGFAISDSGTIVYIPQPENIADSGIGIEQRRTLVWVDRNGNVEPLGAPAKNYRYPKISPEGSELAISVQAQRTDIWIWDFARETLTPLTFEGASNITPIWTLDGEKIVFLSIGRADAGLSGGLYWKASNGTGEDELLYTSQEGFLIPYSFSSDESFLALTKIIDTANQDLGILSMEGERGLRMLLQKEYMEIQPQISPNGRFIAYTSNESGQNEVYVRPFPNVNGGRWRVSTDVGDSPLWSTDGSELFYLVGNTEAVMAVRVETELNFEHDNPKVLFRGKYVGAAPSDGTPYDIHPKDGRFLMLKPSMQAGGGSTEEIESLGPRKINVFLNWFEELKEKVPTD